MAGSPKGIWGTVGQCREGLPQGVKGCCQYSRKSGRSRRYRGELLAKAQERGGHKGGAVKLSARAWGPNGLLTLPWGMGEEVLPLVVPVDPAPVGCLGQGRRGGRGDIRPQLCGEAPAEWRQ